MFERRAKATKTAEQETVQRSLELEVLQRRTVLSATNVLDLKEQAQDLDRMMKRMPHESVPVFRAMRERLGERISELTARADSERLDRESAAKNAFKELWKQGADYPSQMNMWVDEFISAFVGLAEDASHGDELRQVSFYCPCISLNFDSRMRRRGWCLGLLAGGCNWSTSLSSEEGMDTPR